MLSFLTVVAFLPYIVTSFGEEPQGALRIKLSGVGIRSPSEQDENLACQVFNPAYFNVDARLTASRRGPAVPSDNTDRAIV